MQTRMMSKMDVLDARVAAVESTFKNHNSSLKEHTALLINHTSSLSSLESNVAKISKPLAMMHAEMRKGFQQQQRSEGGKKRKTWTREPHQTLHSSTPAMGLDRRVAISLDQSIHPQKTINLWQRESNSLCFVERIHMAGFLELKFTLQ